MEESPTEYRNLLKANIEALHEAAFYGRNFDFISRLPIYSREKPTLEIEKIIQKNLDSKKDRNRKSYTLPILTQAFGAGKTFFMESLPKLFEQYCPGDKELKESYHIFIDLRRLRRLPRKPDDVIDRLYSLIFTSFLDKYDAVPKPFPKSIFLTTLETLVGFITGYTSTEDFEELLIQLKVNQQKINLIVKDFENKKYPLIILEIDELKTAENEQIYSDKENQIIQKKINANQSNTRMKQEDLNNLIRLYYFWSQLVTLMQEKYFELIVAGKGTSGLLGYRIPFDLYSPSCISQIILDPLTKEDIKNILDEVLVILKIPDEVLLNLTIEIYDLTAGHPLYVGYSIYFYYRSILEKKNDFKLKAALESNCEVILHFRSMINNIGIYKKVKELKQFFINVYKSFGMDKNKIHHITDKRETSMTTVELLDNLGISYSNGGDLIKPILPGIFEGEYFNEFSQFVTVRSIQEGMKEEEAFGVDFLDFSRKLYENFLNEGKINIKQMFSFLENFPDFNISQDFTNRCLSLPTIAKCKDKLYENCILIEHKKLNFLYYVTLLRGLKENVLYWHEETSSSSDYVYVRGFHGSKKKLFLFFQIKHVTGTVNLVQEYEKVFFGDHLEKEKDFLFRLIIFNTAKSDQNQFNAAYKVYYYEDKKMKPLLCKYNEMEEQSLMYVVSYEAALKFKNNEVVRNILRTD